MTKRLGHGRLGHDAAADSNHSFDAVWMTHGVDPFSNHESLAIQSDASLLVVLLLIPNTYIIVYIVHFILYMNNIVSYRLEIIYYTIYAAL